MVETEYRLELFLIRDGGVRSFSRSLNKTPPPFGRVSGEAENLLMVLLRSLRLLQMGPFNYLCEGRKG